MTQMVKADRFGRLRTMIYSVSILIYVFTDIFGFHFLTNVLSICAIASILIALPKLGKIGITLTALFLLFGFLILWQHHESSLVFMNSFGGMFNQLALFSIIPLISIPIKVGGYGAAIQQLLESRIKNPSQLYRSVSLYSFILSCFMNLATLPMMYFGVKNTLESFPIKQVKRFASNGIVHGFAIPILWTPVAPIVGVVVDLTHVEWVKMFPLLFVLSIAALLLDWGIYHLARSKYEMKNEELLGGIEASTEIAATVQTAHLPATSKKQLKQTATAVILFITLIISIQHFLSIGLMSTVILLTLPFALLWSFLIGKAIPFVKEGIDHFKVKLPNMSDQYAIFLSAGFFVAAIQVTGSNNLVNLYISDLAHTIGSHLFVTFLPIIPLLLAFIGMHPALAISLLAGSLSPTALGISSEELAIALLGGAVSTFMLGPFNATTGLMSSILKTSTFQVVRWNVGYTAAFLGLIIVVLFIW